RPREDFFHKDVPHRALREALSFGRDSLTEATARPALLPRRCSTRKRLPRKSHIYCAAISTPDGSDNPCWPAAARSLGDIFRCTLRDCPLPSIAPNSWPSSRARGACSFPARCCMRHPLAASECRTVGNSHLPGWQPPTADGFLVPRSGLALRR